MESSRGRKSRWLGLACALVLPACGARSSVANLYPQLVEHEAKRIDDVRFTGTEPFQPDTLLSLTETQPSRCNFLGLPLCVPFTRIGRAEHFLSLQRVHADVQTLERFYRIAGYFATDVTPTVEPDGSNVDVTFSVRRGDPVVLDHFTVLGTEGVLAPDSLAERLPIRAGDLFHLGRYLAASDSVLRGMQRRGHVYAEVLRSFTVDTVDNRAEATVEAIPGPRVTIDSIIVLGADNLGRSTAMRHLEFREGDLLRSSQLLESQRNLYGLEIVSLASVTVAPDSLQKTLGDSTRATVLVSVVEAAVNELEAAIGFGTIECLRTDTQWANRSFMGGARRLGLRGSLSRLGVGDPFTIGAGERVCTAFRGDTTFGGTAFDYRFAADFAQPAFLSPRNQLGVNAFAERLSEPGIFQRDAVGGRIGVTRRLSLRSGAAFGVDGERGTTRASPALFCAAFQVCDPVLIDSLQAPRFQLEMSATAFTENTDNRINPTRGRVLRSTLSWAPRWLGGDVSFLRMTGDAAVYVPVRERYVAAFALRVGNFFRTVTLDPTTDFLPPEERFYAGGATSVRGFERNALGPGVYVTNEVQANEAGDTVPVNENPQFVATGGTSVLVVSAEVRMPSPVLRDRLRLVGFIDGGSIGTGSLWDVGLLDMKFTPGLGFRMQTPVGPVRLDIAYNPHRRPAAPLLLNDIDTGVLRRVSDVYRPPSRGFFGRMRLHLGIGHAF